MTRLIRRLSEPKNLLFLGVAYTLFIALASIAPTKDLPKLDISWLDKISHVVLYAILAALWLLYVFVKNNHSILLKHLFWVLLICFGYGIVIEALQEWCTTFRRADVMDVIANLVGVLAGWWIFSGLRSIVQLKT